ncbi:protein CHROMATIN REMODELING 24 isoform X2 [Euphorbia lathyris]|uniref:protein CHROMATIN REMODELING 24 isoform X2 n=1 Tax=Euphorbia lathyris TaxID=212925 RepID=UPI0033142BF2
MGDKTKSNRKPVSLNDSHYRLLQDLSAPPKPSSSAEEGNPCQMKPESRRRLCKGSATQTQHFVNNIDDDDDPSIPHYSGITDFDSSSENLTKVKIEGRRRLCKVSSRDKENAGGMVPVQNEPSFSEITDFDSPLPCKPIADGKSDQGADEIRDILNDLSSRLDLLSIDRKQGTHKVDHDGSEFFVGGDREKLADVLEYASATSSFSGGSCDLAGSPSDPAGSPSDPNNVVGYGIVDEHDEGHLLSNASGEYFVDKFHQTKNNSQGRADGKLMTQGNSVVSNVEEEEDSDLGTESEGDNYVKRERKTESTLLKMKNESKSTVSNVEEEEDSNLGIESEGDNYVKRERKTESTLVKMKNESKQVDERLRFGGQSYMSILRNEDEEDGGDSFTFSGKKEAEGAGSQAFKESSVINLSDDSDDDAVLKEDGSITFSGSRSTYILPGQIAKMLYPHQRDGLKWLWSLHCQGKGGILGDDMGLGKTMQICGFLAGLFHSRLIKRALIVAPKTLLSHWIKELSTVGLSEKIREYFGTSSKAREYELQYILQDKGVLLTTYDIVRNNSKSLRGDGYFADEESEDGYTWDYMILDEGHLIKNPSTQRAKSLLEIPSAHRVIISGTPIQNNLKEMWTLFNFSCPDLLGDYKWFKGNYEHFILRGNEKNASAREKHVGSRVAKELRERIQPYFLRRMKSEVFKENDSTTATLSKKSEMIVWLRLSSCQRQLYEAFLHSELVLSAFDGSPLAALTILKKICDHPLLLTKRAAEDVLEGMDSMQNAEEDAGLAEKLAMHIADLAEKTEFQEKHNNVSCKISFILSLLDELIPNGHNVLIFSQTRKMLNLIQESLVSHDYKFLRIDGTTKASDRVQIVNDFQEGIGAPVFLLTSQVGGLGLTLTKADRVIVVDPAWNPSTDSQSVDRAYRIGQKKDVLVYRLMTCGTVEEKIYRKQIFKGGLFKSATEHKEQIRYFSQQDLRELFCLPKQGFDVSVTQQQLHEEHDNQHKMDEFLEAHVKFLETLGIAGVSHHSLLFSKTAPVQDVNLEDEDIRRNGSYVRNASSSYSQEHNVDGAEHAFNPKDVKVNKKISSPDSFGKLTESEIKDRISRLSQILGNKVTVSRLPDKGAKLQRQVLELNLEVEKMKMEKTREKQVIDLDDLTGELQRVLNV